MDITSLLPLSGLQTQTPALTPSADPTLPTDFAALLAQASLSLPGQQAPTTTPALPSAPGDAEALTDAGPAGDEDVLLSPDTLALMASLPGITPPPPQHTSGGRSEQATPVALATDIPAAGTLATGTPAAGTPAAGTPAAPPLTAPATTAPTAPPAAPTLTAAVQQQAEQVEAPMISPARDPAPTLANTAAPVSTAPAAAALPAPLGSPQWPTDFSQQLVHLTRGLRGGEQRVEMHLNPAHLGPLSVSLTLDDQQAQAQFFSAHGPVRAAVEQAIPQLREALAEQGISLGEAMVGEHRQPPGDRHAGHDGQRHAGRGVPANEPSGTPVTVTAPVTAHGVDLYA